MEKLKPCLFTAHRSHHLIYKTTYNQQRNKINDQTKPNKNTHIDIENRVVVTRQGGWAGGG